MFLNDRLGDNQRMQKRRKKMYNSQSGYEEFPKPAKNSSL
jgi:hypothetical protein